MSQHPPADRRAHHTFCDTEGWTVRVSARGKQGQDHVKFELELDDGRVLLTRISHPANRTTYAPSMWSHILRNQLDVSADVFWSCVSDGVLPSRSQPQPVPASLPAGLVHQLLVAGFTQPQVAEMTLAEATAHMTEIWSRPSP